MVRWTIGSVVRWTIGIERPCGKVDYRHREAMW